MAGESTCEPRRWAGDGGIGPVGSISSPAPGVEVELVGDRAGGIGNGIDGAEVVGVGVVVGV